MMVMTEETFSELVQFINTHPTWRRKLRKALFPDIDVAKSFQLLAETQKEMQKTLQQLTNRTERIEKNVTLLTNRTERIEKDVTLLTNRTERIEKDVTVLKRDMKQVKGDVADLKGYNYERRIINYATSIFGSFMRRGKDVRNEIGNLLEEAEENGVITEQEHDHILALDLLWGGKQKKTKANIVLAIEVSWRAEETDIARSLARSNTLRKIGLTALPVVAGAIWDEAIITLAHKQKVVCIIDKTVDASSWENAF